MKGFQNASSRNLQKLVPESERSDILSAVHFPAWTADLEALTRIAFCGPKELESNSFASREFLEIDYWNQSSSFALAFSSTSCLKWSSELHCQRRPLRTTTFPPFPRVVRVPGTTGNATVPERARAVLWRPVSEGSLLLFD